MKYDPLQHGPLPSELTKEKNPWWAPHQLDPSKMTIEEYQARERHVVKKQQEIRAEMEKLKKQGTGNSIRETVWYIKRYEARNQLDILIGIQRDERLAKKQAKEIRQIEKREVRSLVNESRRRFEKEREPEEAWLNWMEKRERSQGRGL